MDIFTTHHPRDLYPAYPHLPESLNAELQEHWRQITFVGLEFPSAPEAGRCFFDVGHYWFLRCLEEDRARPWQRWPHLFFRWMVARVQFGDPHTRQGVWAMLGEPFDRDPCATQIRNFYRDRQRMFKRQINRWEGAFYFVNQLLLHAIISPQILTRARHLKAQLETHPKWRKFVLNPQLSEEWAGLALAEIACEHGVDDPILAPLLDAENGAPQALVELFRILDQDPHANAEKIGLALIKPVLEWPFDWSAESWGEDGPLIRFTRRLPSGYCWQVAGQVFGDRFQWIPPLEQQSLGFELLDTDGNVRNRIQVRLWPLVIPISSGGSIVGGRLSPERHAIAFVETDWPELEQAGQPFEDERLTEAGLRWAVLEVMPSPHERIVDIDGIKFQIPRRKLDAPQPVDLLSAFDPPVMTSADWHEADASLPVRLCERMLHPGQKNWDEVLSGRLASAGSLLQARWVAGGEPATEWAPTPAPVYLPGFKFYTPPWRDPNREAYSIHAELPQGISLRLDGQTFKPAGKMRYAIPAGTPDIILEITDLPGRHLTQVMLNVPAPRWACWIQDEPEFEAARWTTRFLHLTPAQLDKGLCLALDFGHKTYYGLEFHVENQLHRYRRRTNQHGYDLLDSALLREYGLASSQGSLLYMANEWCRFPIAGHEEPAAEKPFEPPQPPAPEEFQLNQPQLAAWLPRYRPGQRIPVGPMQLDSVFVGQGLVRAVLHDRADIVAQSNPIALWAAGESEATLLLEVPVPAVDEPDRSVRLDLEWSADGHHWQAFTSNQTGELLAEASAAYILPGHESWLSDLKRTAAAPDATADQRLSCLQAIAPAEREPLLRQWQATAALPDAQLTLLLPHNGVSWMAWRELPTDLANPDLRLEYAIAMPAAMARATLDLIAGAPPARYDELAAASGAMQGDAWWQLFRLMHDYLSQRHGQAHHAMLHYQVTVPPELAVGPRALFQAAAQQLAIFVAGLTNIRASLIACFEGSLNCWQKLPGLGHAAEIQLPPEARQTLAALRSASSFIIHREVPWLPEPVEQSIIERFLREELGGILVAVDRTWIIRVLRLCWNTVPMIQPEMVNEFSEAIMRGHCAMLADDNILAGAFYQRGEHLGSHLEKRWLKDLLAQFEHNKE